MTTQIYILKSKSYKEQIEKLLIPNGTGPQ